MARAGEADRIWILGSALGGTGEGAEPGAPPLRSDSLL